MGSLIRKVVKSERKIEETVHNDNRGILLKRLYGGIGDILMTRPLMREIKKINSEVVLHYAIPKNLIPLVVDLEEIDEVMPVENIGDEDESQYGWSGDISTACVKHEVMFRSRVHDQRMDIWAKHVQIELSQHHAALKFTNEECEKARQAVAMTGCNPDRYMALVPMSADKSRTLPDQHIDAACSWAKQNGFHPLMLTEHQWAGGDLCPNLYGLELRVWMAAIAQASVFFGTDTGGLHVAGFSGVPGVAVFCHTSGKVVCKHYSSIVPVQMHRDDPGGMACCPCYDWGSCPHSNKQLPLRCIADLHPNKIQASLNSAMLKDNGKRRYGHIELLNWSKVRSDKVSSMASNNDVKTPKSQRVGIVLSCREDRPGLAAIAGCISAIARSTHRNTMFYVRMDGKSSEMLYNHRYATLVHDEVDERQKCADEWENHVLDGLMSSRKSIVDAVNERFGIDVRNGYPCIYCDQESMATFESELNKKKDFWFVSSAKKVACKNYEVVYDNSSWNWRTRTYAMSCSIAVVTDNIDVAVVAALSRYALVYLGDRQYLLDKLPHVYICTNGVPVITPDTLKVIDE